MSFVDMIQGGPSVQNESSPSVMEIQAMSLEEGVTPEQLRETDGVVSYVKEKFKRAEDKRFTDEARWLDCWKNFRGVYDSKTQFSQTEQSQVFIKITKTKVQAAYAQIVDVLFAGNKFPIGIEPPKVGVGVEEAVHFDPKAAMGQGPQAGAQPSLRGNPQMTPQIAKLFTGGPNKGLLEKVKDNLKAGVGVMPGEVTYEPGKEAAVKLEKVIHDQLNEAGATKSLRATVSEMCLFGAGVYKGPFALDKEYPKWGPDGTYEPITKTIPDMSSVSIWNAYPDADARSVDDLEHFIERHRMSRTQLRGLKKRPAFRKKNIEQLIADGPNYDPKWWEADLQDDGDATTEQRWEVLEFWGLIDAEIAKESGIKIPKEYKNYDEYQINAWVSGDFVLRLVINPFKPARIPYHIIPYETNAYSVFGVGVAENMLDSQLLMNGFMRMAVDNAALSGNIIFEINEDMLRQGQTMELHPGKIFYRQGGYEGKAVQSTKFDNITNELLQMFDKARQLSDESTGMPSYAHGMTGIQSTGKTAAGMSMLMGAAAQNIKAVVRNIDDYLLEPLGRDLFSFNMQYNWDKDYIGDVVVVAKGTESLMRNEVRSQKLLQLGQFAAGNPAIAPYVKWDYILREFCASMDLDEDKIVNDPRAAAIQAVEMAKFQQMAAPPGEQGQQAQAQANQQVPGGGAPSPDDPTGQGGTVQPGAAPGPDEQGFSGNPEQAPQPVQ